MGLLSGVLGGAVGKILGQVRGVFDDLHHSSEEKDATMLKVEAILTERLSEAEETLRTEITAKQAIMVAEMQQEDRYTKRARPTIVYSGLVLIFLDFLVRVIAFFFVPELPTPSGFVEVAFLATWGSVCGVYSIGRSAEKRGVNNQAVSAVTGAARPALGL